MASCDCCRPQGPKTLCPHSSYKQTVPLVCGGRLSSAPESGQSWPLRQRARLAQLEFGGQWGGGGARGGGARGELGLLRG